jgi:hypothetical protein
VGSIVAGKLANFTILSDNPVTVPAVKIKDIKIWGTVHEGRILPVQNQDAAKIALGPVASDATFKAMDLDALAHEKEVEGHGDICKLNQLFAAAMTSRN